MNKHFITISTWLLVLVAIASAIIFFQKDNLIDNENQGTIVTQTPNQTIEEFPSYTKTSNLVDLEQYMIFEQATGRFFTYNFPQRGLQIDIKPTEPNHIYNSSATLLSVSNNTIIDSFDNKLHIISYQDDISNLIWSWCKIDKERWYVYPESWTYNYWEEDWYCKWNGTKFELAKENIAYFPSIKQNLDLWLTYIILGQDGCAPWPCDYISDITVLN